MKHGLTVSICVALALAVGAAQAQAQAPTQSAACNDIEQRTIINQTRLNACDGPSVSGNTRHGGAIFLNSIFLPPGYALCRLVTRIPNQTMDAC